MLKMDVICVKGILCRVHLGITDEERANPQIVVVDARVSLDLEAAVNSDDVTLTVDYADIVRQIQSRASERPIRLVEALAGRLCSAVLANPGVEAVKLTVRKRPRDLEEVIDCVEVEISRSNS